MALIRLMDIEEIIDSIGAKSRECMQLATLKTSKAQKNFLIGRAEGYSDAIQIIAEHVGMEKLPYDDEDDNES